jgi:hypothetical protein
MRGQTLDEVLKLEANEPADDLTEILGLSEEEKKTK